MRKWFSAVILTTTIVALAMGGLSCKGPQLDEPICFITLSEDDMYFNTDKTAIAGGGDIGGTVFITLNDAEITDFSGGCKAQRISVQKGVNILRIAGKAEKEFYLRIIYVPASKQEENRVLVREVITPGKIKEQIELTFNIKRE